MIFPVSRPNLPQYKVHEVAVSDYSDILIKKLNELNINPVVTSRSSNLDKSICYHTDMLMLHLQGNTILADESQKNNIVKYLTMGYELRFINIDIKSPYPYDSFLNAVVLGDKLICCKNTIHKDVIDCAVNNNYQIINVNQGYTKCSVCIINDSAIITDDESLYRACGNIIDTLYISKGSIKLDGFDYGFIGGCTGLIDKDKLLFNGDINYHKDCNRIIDFLGLHDIKPVIIESQPLTDIGSILPLTEENPC